MYDIFEFFPRETRSKAITYGYDPSNRGFVNPVEACVYTQFGERFVASNDHRDIAKLAQFLVHETMVNRGPEDYAKAYNDYKEFLDWWNDNADGCNREHNEKLLTEAMGLNDSVKKSVPVEENSKGTTIHEILNIMTQVHRAAFESFALSEDVGVKLLRRLAQDLLTLTEVSGKL